MKLFQKLFGTGANLLSQGKKFDIEAGDVVKVLPYELILRTLDENGYYDGLLFMESMKQYCNKEYEVLRVVRWVYDENSRRMLRCKDIVILSDVICDGKGMLNSKDCDRSCLLFWKTAWLEKS